MSQQHWRIAVLALIGLMVGLILFVHQPAGFAADGMNPLGIVAFCSLGASVGCLLADRDGSSRR